MAPLGGPDDRTAVRRLEFVPVEPLAPAPVRKPRAGSGGSVALDADAPAPAHQPPAAAETRWSLWGDVEG